jgi:hypothetical protein
MSGNIQLEKPDSVQLALQDAWSLIAVSGYVTETGNQRGEKSLRCVLGAVCWGAVKPLLRFPHSYRVFIIKLVGVCSCRKWGESLKVDIFIFLISNIQWFLCLLNLPNIIQEGPVSLRFPLGKSLQMPRFDSAASGLGIKPQEQPAENQRWSVIWNSN